MPEWWEYGERVPAKPYVLDFRPRPLAYRTAWWYRAIQAVKAVMEWFDESPVAWAIAFGLFGLAVVLVLAMG